MTNQIVIKLNEEKFKPLLDKLKAESSWPVANYSELVGKLIFFEHFLWNERCDKLGNKTKMEFLLEKIDLSRDELTIDFLQRYIDFVKSGEINNNNNNNNNTLGKR